jgi:hypothetical protein
MKKYVITFDKYLPLLKGFAYFFNKYWSKDEEIIVLCYEKPSFSLPDNFIIHSLGRQKNYGRYWTNALIPYFKNVPEKYFLILLEDLFLREPIDLEILKEMEDIVKRNGADKACLHKIVAKSDWEEVVSDNIVKINRATRTAIGHRTTLQPAIWSKKRFLKYLKPNYTAWDFEILNEYNARTEDSVVIGPRNKRVYFKLNLILKGRINNKGLRGVKLSDEDNQVLLELIKLWK